MGRRSTGNARLAVGRSSWSESVKARRNDEDRTLAGRIRGALLKSPENDEQRELVYIWEDDCFKAQIIYGRMTRKQARRLVDRMCRWYGCSPPIMRWLNTGHRKWRAQQVPSGLELNMTKGGWSPLLIAHEVAHWICEQKKLDKQPHDAIWMAVYMNLLDHYRIVPIEATVATAKRYTVEFKAPAKYLPGRV